MAATDEGYRIALEEAEAGLKEGGIPVGGCVVSKTGEVLGRGRNMRIQNGSHILHGETAAFDNARQHPGSAFFGSTIYTTLSPCPMCAGSMVWFRVARVVIGDNVNMTGREEFLRNHGIEVVVLDEPRAKAFWAEYQKNQNSSVEDL